MRTPRSSGSGAFKCRARSLCLVVAGVGLLLCLLLPAAATGFVEDFDGWSEGAYGNHTYVHAGIGTWVLNNGLCADLKARSGNAVRFERAAPTPSLEFQGLDGNGHDGGIGDISFYYAHWDGDANAVQFQVQIDDGGGWSNVGPAVTATTGTYLLHTVTLNDTRDNLKVRILSLAYQERLLVDDFELTEVSSSSGVSLIAPVTAGAEGGSDLQVLAVLSGGVSTTAEIAPSGGSAVAGVDYVLLSSNVVLSAANPTNSFTVQIVDDAESEPVEDLVLQLVNVTGGPVVPGEDSVTLTVQDNEPPLVYFGLAHDRVGESIGSYDIPLVLSSPADVTAQVAVAGCAAPGVDYSLSSTQVVFSSAGSSTQYFSVAVVADQDEEGTEEVRLSITSAIGAETNAPSSFSLYIEDEEDPVTVFTVVSANTTSGNFQEYDGPGQRIFQALQPDVVGIQEFNVPDTPYGGSRRAFVDDVFGTNYHFMVETGDETIPNGVISRWPITAFGEWGDPQVPNRDFAWATIDLPGPVDLHVVSVHLHSSGGVSSRQIEASILTNMIYSSFPATDYVVLCGDLNVGSRTETAVQTLKTLLSDAHQPADQASDKDTNEPRNKPYDYVLPNPTLDALHVALDVGGQTFNEGLVFDTRVWSTPPAPAQAGDSGVSGMQHMAVMKSFTVTAPPSQHTFDVDAGPGQGDPATGSYLWARDTQVNASVTDPVITVGTTQYVCSGWIGTGSVPCEGVGASVPPFALRADSTLTWLWGTNFLLQATAGEHGAVAPTNQWVPAGATGTVVATPDVYYHLASWSGDVDAVTLEGLELKAPADRARTVAAVFGPDLAVHDVPHWWLASYGWTNDFDTHAEADTDIDGAAAWEEFISGHNPTDETSFFAVSGLSKEAGMHIALATEPGRRYEIAFNDEGGLGPVPAWNAFSNSVVGAHEEVGISPSNHVFIDTFDPASSGYAPVEGYRMYRVSVDLIP